MIRISRARALFTVLAAGPAMLAVTSIPRQAVAHSGANAVKECRTSVGKPVVQACVRSKVQRQGGQPRAHLRDCRRDAMPVVRACVERTVSHLVANCRETVGRPMVQACVQNRMRNEGGPRHVLVAHCRLSVSWAVRSCVWRSADATSAGKGQ